MAKQVQYTPASLPKKTVATIMARVNDTSAKIRDAQGEFIEAKSGQLNMFATIATEFKLDTHEKIERIRQEIIKEDNGRTDVAGDASFNRQRANKFRVVAWAAPHYNTIVDELHKNQYVWENGKVKLDANGNKVLNPEWPIGENISFVRACCALVDEDRELDMSKVQKKVEAVYAKKDKKPTDKYFKPEYWKNQAKALGRLPDDVKAAWPGIDNLIKAYNEMEFTPPAVNDVVEKVESRPEATPDTHTTAHNIPGNLDDVMAKLAGMTAGMDPSDKKDVMLAMISKL